MLKVFLRNKFRRVCYVLTWNSSFYSN